MKNVNLTNRAERTVLKSHSAHWLTFADWICKQRPYPAFHQISSQQFLRERQAAAPRAYARGGFWS